MALVDMYEIVYDATIQGQSVLSVYHVVRSSAIENAATISDGFQTSILPILRLQQNDNIISNELRIFNLGTPTDFGTFTLGSAAGLRAGLSSPTFISGAVRFPSLNRDVRSGHKRFVGMEETDYFDGTINAAANTLLENNGDAMIGNWLSSIDAHVICNYVVIMRICKTVDPVTGKCLVYRLPDDNLELVFYQPTSRIVNQEISSQVSRKVF